MDGENEEENYRKKKVRERENISLRKENIGKGIRKTVKGNEEDYE